MGNIEVNKISQFKQKLQNTTNALQAEINTAQSVIEEKYLDTKNTIQLTVDTVNGVAVKTVGAIVGLVEIAISLGIVFAAFTAPVPAAIGGAIILLGTHKIGHSIERRSVAVTLANKFSILSDEQCRLVQAVIN